MIARPQARGPAAVHAEVGAGDRRRLVAAQEQRQRRDLFGRDEPLGRLGGEQHVVDHLLAGQAAGLHRVGDLVLDQRRPDIAGRDAIDGDAVARGLQRDRLGEARDAMLGGDIGRLVGRGDEAVRPRGVDDPAPALPSSPASARRVVWNTAVRLMAMIASHLSGGKLSTGATCWIPALLTRMSGAPSSVGAARDHRLDRRGVGQVGAVVERAELARSARDRRRASPKPLIMTRRPRAASARAMASPIPEVEPVTSATLPSRAFNLLSSARSVASARGRLQPLRPVAHSGLEQEEMRMRLGDDGQRQFRRPHRPCRGLRSAEAAATCSAACCRWSPAGSGSSASSSCCLAIAR